MFAYFTASVTTTATVQELHGTISNPGDLFGKRVATVEKSIAAQYLAEQGIPLVTVNDINSYFDIKYKETSYDRRKKNTRSHRFF